jgi:hypothetical protein
MGVRGLPDTHLSLARGPRGIAPSAPSALSAWPAF